MSEKLYWPSRWIFILAAIGSAAGLGNIWRFPYLAFEHGGGAFVFALIIANLAIGIPLLALEVGLGQMMQRGAAGAFGAIKKSFRYVGWAALILGFMVLAYYMAVVSWGINYFASSFTLAWSGNAESFFFNDILNISSGVGIVGGISWPVFSGLLLAWALVYFSVWKGVKSISKVVVWTATLPFVILFILILRAVTLDGATEGLKLFLIPDWSALKNPQLWLAAFSQVFFSLSLAFGIMIAYGSLQRKMSEVTKSVLWIAGGNFLVSIMSGFVVFGTLGYMALQKGVPIPDVIAGGPALAFVVFPEAISLLPAFNTLIGVLFFGMLLSLAIDSAFSLLEAFAVALRDRFPKTSTKKVAFILSVIGFTSGLAYTTGAGLYYLDIVDHFIVNYGLVIIGILEALIVGWFWKGGELKKFINERSEWKLRGWWDASIKFVIPVFLTILLVWNIINELKIPYEGYPSWALLYIGILPLVLVPLIAYAVDRLTKSETT